MGSRQGQEPGSSISSSAHSGCLMGRCNGQTGEATNANDGEVGKGIDDVNEKMQVRGKCWIDYCQFVCYYLRVVSSRQVRVEIFRVV